jgi:hypothetical protein
MLSQSQKRLQPLGVARLSAKLGELTLVANAADAADAFAVWVNDDIAVAVAVANAIPVLVPDAVANTSSVPVASTITVAITGAIAVAVALAFSVDIAAHIDLATWVVIVMAFATLAVEVAFA